MSTKKLSTVTTDLIASYGNTAKNVIQAYRVGNARAVGYVDQTWAAAIKKPASASAPMCAPTPWQPNKKSPACTATAWH